MLGYRVIVKNLQQNKKGFESTLFVASHRMNDIRLQFHILETIVSNRNRVRLYVGDRIIL